ncbi:MAG: type II toxin-antitoxin system PemK/MazF family toxin [Pyrinomonadaceae bacterium]
MGAEDGVKHDSSIHCDNLISLQKSVLTNFIAKLSTEKMAELDQALASALDLPPDLFN